MLRKLHPGYTLIELLVVMLIISLFTSIAVFRMQSQQPLEKFINNQLVSFILLGQQQAMLLPATLGLFSVSGKLVFYQYNEGRWETISHLTPELIPDSIELIPEPLDLTPPYTIISPSGDFSAFSLLIKQKNQAPRYRLQSDSGGNITLEKLP